MRDQPTYVGSASADLVEPIWEHPGALSLIEEQILIKYFHHVFLIQALGRGMQNIYTIQHPL